MSSTEDKPQIAATEDFTSSAAVAPRVEPVRRSLAQAGYALIEDLGGRHLAVELLQEIGWLMPQHTGSIEHTVTALPEFESISYSQSSNAIAVHTEAPGMMQTPKYVALYCDRQARCGGGQTDILDGHRLLEELTEDERSLMLTRELAFPGPELHDGDGGGLRATMIGRREDSDLVIRYSQNLLSFGDYYPKQGAAADCADLPLGEAGLALSARVETAFRRFCASITIPDRGLLIWDNHRMLHARSQYKDTSRRLTRYWLSRAR